MNPAIHFLDWGIILIYLAALVGIGLWRSQKGRRDEEEFILAGRRLSLPGFVATLVATWYGGILGIGENSFRYGLQTWFIFGLPYYVFALLFALFLAHRIQRSRLVSIPDHFQRHYGKGPAILSAVLILFLASPAAYILSIGVLIQFALGIPLGMALLLATLASLVYIWYGGLGAVVRTDILQFILMFGGFILLVAFAWSQVGSPPEMISRLPATHRLPTGGHSLQYVLVWFFIALWTFVDPGIYQRCAAARSPETARNGILVSVICWFVFDLLTLLAGLYARVALDGDQALFSYPLLGQELLPPLLYGLFLTAIMATIMSTIDSTGLISAITFGRDILWRLKTPTSSPAGEWEEKSTPYIQRGLVVIALIALLLAHSLPSVVRIWYVVGSCIVPGLLVPFLLTFTSYRVARSRTGILILLPVLVALSWFLLGRLWEGYPLGLEPFYPGLVTSLVLAGAFIRRKA